MTLLKRHRLAKGLSQKKLAGKLGVSSAAVCSWESGKFIPDPDKFPKLARILGIDPLTLTEVIAPKEQAAAAH